MKYLTPLIPSLISSTAGRIQFVVHSSMIFRKAIRLGGTWTMGSLHLFKIRRKIIFNTQTKWLNIRTLKSKKFLKSSLQLSHSFAKILLIRRQCFRSCFFKSITIITWPAYLKSLWFIISLPAQTTNYTVAWNPSLFAHK